MVNKNSSYLIQGNFGPLTQPNFEVVFVNVENQLEHWFRDHNNSTLPWNPTRRFSPTGGLIEGKSQLIQSNLGTRGNFEVVANIGAGRLEHWSRNNDIPNSPWALTSILPESDDVSGAPALIQSNFGTTQRNFEVVANRGATLHHWFRNNDIPDSPWVKTSTTNISGVSGGPALIQGNLGTTPQRNFEVVVNVGGRLQHWFRDHSNSTLPWIPTSTFASGVSGGPALIQGNFGPPTRPNFEVIVPVGDRLQHWFRDHSNSTLPWNPTSTFASGVNSPFT